MKTLHPILSFIIAVVTFVLASIASLFAIQFIGSLFGYDLFAQYYDNMIIVVIAFGIISVNASVVSLLIIATITDMINRKYK